MFTRLNRPGYTFAEISLRFHDANRAPSLNSVSGSNCCGERSRLDAAIHSQVGLRGETGDQRPGEQGTELATLRRIRARCRIVASMQAIRPWRRKANRTSPELRASGCPVAAISSVRPRSAPTGLIYDYCSCMFAVMPSCCPGEARCCPSATRTQPFRTSLDSVILLGIPDSVH